MLTRINCFALHAAERWRACGINSKASKGLRFNSSDRKHDTALRVLFCGSDEFSITSLEALHQYAASPDSNIASIDVATKTDKKTGRGLKLIKPPPIKPAAIKLGLPLHQFDTFRGWNLPLLESSGENYINMVIAVSFGLLVPPRILSACPFGGLNVHPSMLPDLKGSTPIEHTIINGYKTTGVTVQTLHPSKFDEGSIVLQTPSPGLAIPHPAHITSLELRDFLAPVGAELLVRSLRERLYLRSQAKSPATGMVKLNHAPRLSPEARRINFHVMTSTHILRLHRAFGRLWIRSNDTEQGHNDTRIILGPDVRLADENDLMDMPEDILDKTQTGLPFTITNTKSRTNGPASALLVKCADGKFVCMPTICVSGQRSGSGAAMAAKANLLGAAEGIGGDLMLRRFRTLLG